MTEAWVRNPITCIRECAELLHPLICWDRGFLRKNRIDAQKHIETHYPRAVDYRCLLIGDQGAAELRRGHSMSNPAAVYPVWEYGVQMIPDLEKMMKQQTLPKGPTADECGVEGQEHRVVIINPPSGATRQSRALRLVIGDLMEECPDCIIHYHGTYSFAIAFGSGFQASDFDPVADASKGRITLSSGRRINWERAPEFAHWVNVHGFTFGSLSVPRNRTMFNIKSAVWAGMYWDDELNFASRSSPGSSVDPNSPVPVPVRTKSHLTKKSTKPLAGDKLSCDHCSLAPVCKAYRAKGVCIISSSDASGLARFFKTRDSDKIIEGLGELLAQKAQRLQGGIADEALRGDGLDPAVTQLEGQLFEHAVKLAKLVDPKLAAAGASRIQINNVNGGHAAVGAGSAITKQSLMAEVVRELEAQGVHRDEITPVMVAQHLAAHNQKAIEAVVVDP